MKAQHTPGPWKVMADPINKGRHPLHENRWITTADAETETNGGEEWRLTHGSLICQVRDTERQPYNAKLLAAAPDLLAAVREILTARDYALTHGGDIMTSSAWANMERAERLATELKP